MGTLFILATEEGGFGFNFDIIGTNLINLSIVIAILVYFGRGFLGNILQERQQKIAETIQEAETRQKNAVEALAESQTKLAQAQAEAERILKTAHENAGKVKAAIAAQTEQEIQRMKETAAQDLSTEQERVMAQLKKQIASQAIAEVESQLKSGLDETTQQQLIDRSIAQLGGN